MLRILFVDDDPNLLDSMRRMAHSERDVWECEFSDSGAGALEIMQSQKFDVIVADMRMPNMDGAELLTEVARLYPDTLRFVLSGHSDKDLILKAVPVTHQFLAKPCESSTLKEKINSSMHLRRLLSSDVLKKRLARVNSIPSLPSTYAALCAELQSEQGTIKSAARIVETDAGLTAKVLQLVNSAFFSLPRHIASVEQAMNLLGLETVRSLTLMTSVFSNIQSTENPDTLSELLSHSTSVGAVSREVAKFIRLDQHSIDDAFFAGALHAVGKVIMLREFKEEIAQIEQLAAQDGVSLVDAEVACLGVSHATIGAYVLATWGLPHSIVEAVAFHLEPGGSQSESPNVTTATYLGDLLVHSQTAPSARSMFLEQVDNEYVARIGLTDQLVQLYDVIAGKAMTQGSSV